ncbi:MAG TPA: ammonium transporter [Acidimicrobiales bacterium]|nr:ammonium transporter [Acidimicrobiales bacterium]
MVHTDSGDTAWVLVSAALVLFMTPGLALFYGGMVRRANVLGMLIQNLAVMAVVSLLWVWVAYSLAFGPDAGGLGLIGTLHFAALHHLGEAVPGYTGATAQHIPPVAFVVFQMMFAIITPALLTGSGADRMRFGGFLAFTVAWVLLVYVPVAHWVFSPTGWLARLGTEDFAGGTVVELNAGVAGAVLALVLGHRRGWPGALMRPHSIPLTVVGGGILWFGWFGFNAGSALTAAGAGTAFVTTNTATAAALLAWIAVERVRTGKPTTLGAISGAIAGAVAITPACGYVSIAGATLIGVLAGTVCALAVGIKYRLRLDDSLDVLAVHGVAGLLGTLLVGVVATRSAAGADGLAYGGGLTLLGHQALAVVTVGAYSAVVTGVIALAVRATIGLRVSEADERTGLDLALFEESAYDLDPAAGALALGGPGGFGGFGAGQAGRSEADQNPGSGAP